GRENGDGELPPEWCTVTSLFAPDVMELSSEQQQEMEKHRHPQRADSIHCFDSRISKYTTPAAPSSRTIFICAVTTAALQCGMYYDSLHRKLLGLPDQSLVYPAHGAGSLCGRAISKETVSTLGEQRRLNYALQPMSKEAFIQVVTADQPEAPPYFTYDAVLNS